MQIITSVIISQNGAIQAHCLSVHNCKITQKEIDDSTSIRYREATKIGHCTRRPKVKQTRHWFNENLKTIWKY